MKRFIALIIFTFLISPQGQPSRIITNVDIAAWYIESDLVIVCHVNQIDTVCISRIDSILEDSIKLKYNIITEKYSVSIDSVLKGKSTRNQNKMITTPNFRTNYSKTKEEDKKFKGINSKGDSIFEVKFNVWDYDYDDSGYFRLGFNKNYLVILKRKNNSFEILYASVCTKELLALIGEIKIKGQSYIEDYLRVK